jgi:hypothetical protein
MAKQDAKQDIFNIGGAPNDEGGEEYVIAQIIAADGWRAVFQEPDGPQRVLGLACFALVEFVPDSPEAAQIPARAIRPMVVDEFGQVEDVEAFEDFVCVVQPGIAVEPVIAYAIKNRERESAK